MTDAPHLPPARLDRRVLEPRGALPSSATHLDPQPEPGEGEARVELELIRLDAAGETAVARASGGSPERMRAGLLEAATERGGLPIGLDGAALVGRVVASRGSGWPDDGTRVAIVPPVGGLPVWLRDVSAWQGGRHIPCSGWVIAGGPGAVLPIGESLDAAAAAGLAEAAHVPSLVRMRSIDAGGLLIIGGATTGGALALAAAGEDGRPAVATVTSLAEARVARALGAVAADIVALDPAADAVEQIRSSLPWTPSAVVLADPRPQAPAVAGALASALDATLVVVRPEDVPTGVAAASGAGSSAPVVTGRTLNLTSGQEVAEMIAASPLLSAVAAWRAGVAGPPDDGRPEDA